MSLLPWPPVPQPSDIQKIWTTQFAQLQTSLQTILGSLAPTGPNSTTFRQLQYNNDIFLTKNIATINSSGTPITFTQDNPGLSSWALGLLQSNPWIGFYYGAPGATNLSLLTWIDTSGNIHGANVPYAPPTTVLITSSGSWVPPVNTRYFEVTITAGGGGGGAGFSTGSAGAGGAAGGTCKSRVTTLVGSYTVSVGNGGPGGGTSGANGTTGGNTTFAGGAISMTANGGTGGNGSGSLPYPGTAGGTATGGNILNLQGGSGASGYPGTASGGVGGASFWGGGAQGGQFNGGNGANSGLYGTGGGGGGGGSPWGTGGIGAAGIIMIDIYT